ncbi:type II toxin-antitoxin system YafQ family toxin [Limosilactobacillus pontis]|uniref:type II toxin-antitoxin system YafQ family toxin n=1 Tax=Limosilactobacillus pontis TaxID=35787 RepID=UPI001E130422|nr:type II toxin-antitoxin system YafQ family toxin [Limosilactobacillus pontis]HJE27073.1 type II toxin-antitoxin system YafQ family toxin [Limosilactobacillus pontis]
MINNNWRICFDRRFQLDVNKWKNQVDDLQGELRDIVDYIIEYGEIPSEYDPHELVDLTLPYTGTMDFHLFDGKVDLLVIYTEINKHRVFRFMRLGSHNELFH